MRYIVFAFVFVVFIVNFGIKAIATKFFGKELNEVQEAVAKSICFLLALIGVVYIIFFG